MTNVNPYLIFNGTCEAAFLFYKSIFGGDFVYMGRFGDMPPSDDPIVLHQVLMKQIELCTFHYLLVAIQS
jgi:uncharacterized glyoxalase superfamily protein PhnB